MRHHVDQQRGHRLANQSAPRLLGTFPGGEVQRRPSLAATSGSRPPGDRATTSPPGACLGLPRGAASSYRLVGRRRPARARTRTRQSPPPRRRSSWRAEAAEAVSRAFVLRAPRVSSCATIIATISSYPRSSAMVSGPVASRLGQMPPRVSAPASSSSRVISTSRFMTAMWRARISKPAGPPRIRSTISGRRARSARAAPRSPFCTASCNLVVVTPSTAAFSFGQLSNPSARQHELRVVQGEGLRRRGAMVGGTSMTASGD